MKQVLAGIGALSFALGITVALSLALDQPWWTMPALILGLVLFAALGTLAMLGATYALLGKDGLP